MYLKCEKATGVPSSVLATRYLTTLVLIFQCELQLYQAAVSSTSVRLFAEFQPQLD